jgi:transcriptional regulator with XRE-family HTH domain
MEITDKIRAIMASKGITQTELAKKLDLTQAAISSQLNRNMRVDNFLNILKALDVNPIDFFQETQTTQTQTTIICPHCGKPIKITLS